MLAFFQMLFGKKTNIYHKCLFWKHRHILLSFPVCEVVSIQNAMFEDTCQTIAIISHSVGVCEEKANTRQVYSQGSGLYLS